MNTFPINDNGLEAEEVEPRFGFKVMLLAIATCAAFGPWLVGPCATVAVFGCWRMAASESRPLAFVGRRLLWGALLFSAAFSIGRW